LGRAQFPILKFQLDLMNFQILDHVSRVDGIMCLAAQGHQQIG
jgi:hypothetical protein